MVTCSYTYTYFIEFIGVLVLAGAAIKTSNCNYNSNSSIFFLPTAHGFTIPVSVSSSIRHYEQQYHNNHLYVTNENIFQNNIIHHEYHPILPSRLFASITSSTSSSTQSSSWSSHDDDDTDNTNILLLRIQQQQEQLKQQVLDEFKKNYKDAVQYSDSFSFTNPTAVASFYSLFLSLRTTPVPLGLIGIPFVIRSTELDNSINTILSSSSSSSSENNNLTDTIDTTVTSTTNFQNFFTMKHLQNALQDDFLDAARGSTDNRKGWQITDVSQPRGDSFDDARMTYTDVVTALDKGTVIFNAAGAHIPILAEPTLACTDATVLPCALNLYVTAVGKRTSAPPHTDRQDVIVIQTSGRKHWKVYSVPEPSIKPFADIFARGKVDDNLPLYTIENDPKCHLLIDTTLYPGDVLFCPAGFPHTTSTVKDDTDWNNRDKSNEIDGTSIHMTLGIDHHIWELDYTNARQLAYRRAGVIDKSLGGDTSNTPYTGKVNELPASVRSRILAELPLGLLDDDEERSNKLVEVATNELQQINDEVDTVANNVIDRHIVHETIVKLQQVGKELLEIHRDMYLAAIDEGRIRDAEQAILGQLDSRTVPMTPERMQRLSLFRVKHYFDRIDRCKKQLVEWSYSGTSRVVTTPTTSSSSSSSVQTMTTVPVLPEDWAYTMPVYVGDTIEAELAGAMFDATVTAVTPVGTYDVTFFDGDKEYGLSRKQIKLLTPPPPSSLVTDFSTTTTTTSSSTKLVDTSKMTPKQLKRWKKEQEKLLSKKRN